MRTRPFAAWRPARGADASVIAPPYDVVTRREASAYIARHPDSILSVTRADATSLDGAAPTDGRTYEVARENLRRLVTTGRIMRDEEAGYYIYRAEDGGHVQSGVACLVAADDYRSNRIRRHELTRPDKETDRVRLIVETASHAEAVMLTHRHSPAVVRAIAEACDSRPLACVATDDGVVHSLWRLDSDEVVEAISTMDAFYVADGHHRCAAAVRAAAEIDQRGDAPDDSHRWLPAVVFDETVLRILPYHRLLRGLVSGVVENIDAALRTQGKVVPLRAAAIPPRGSFAVCAGGQWRLFTPPPTADHSLDVELLSRALLLPVFGIADERNDERLDFVGGTEALATLESETSSDPNALAIALHPTSLADVLRVADADGVMPPKSTWFDPKIVSGLFFSSFGGDGVE